MTCTLTRCRVCWHFPPHWTQKAPIFLNFCQILTYLEYSGFTKIYRVMNWCLQYLKIIQWYNISTRCPKKLCSRGINYRGNNFRLIFTIKVLLESSINQLFHDVNFFLLDLMLFLFQLNRKSIIDFPDFSTAHFDLQRLQVVISEVILCQWSTHTVMGNELGVNPHGDSILTIFMS